MTITTAAVGVAPGQSVLEIATESGYQAAVPTRTGARVHSIEIVSELALSAAKRLKRLDFSDVTARSGDGFVGWPDAASFDAIVVAAGAATIAALLFARPGDVRAADRAGRNA